MMSASLLNIDVVPPHWHAACYPEKSYIFLNCDILANLYHPEIMGIIPTFQIRLDRSDTSS